VTPPVSIVITCFNYERFLADAILTARYQTLNGAEIVVVDDGSTDDSAAAAKALGVRVVQQENRGLAAARNRGIAETSADWIAFLDADDLWETHKLERQYAAVCDEQGIVLCHTDCVFLHGDGTEDRRPRKLEPPERGCPFAHLLPTNRIFSSSAMVRRDAVLRAGGFDENLDAYEDVDLWFRMAAHGDFLFLPDRLIKYRLHGANTSSLGREFWEGSFTVLQDRVLANWDVLSARFEPREKRRYRRLLRRLIALCYSGQGKSLAREGRWAGALSSHWRALGSYPWLPRLYGRFLRTLLLCR
jgi:glycosyltransferase involved in cell wall biosynthesis